MFRGQSHSLHSVTKSAEVSGLESLIRGNG